MQEVRAGTHDYPPPVSDLLPILISPPLPPGQTRTRPRTVGHTVPTRGMFSGTILYFRYNIVLQVQSDVTSRHVTSRHVTSRTMYQLPCYHPSMIAGSSCQGRSMEEYINIIWKLHGRWVCCNILPQCFVNFFIAGEAREQVRLLPHPGRAGVAGPGLRLVAPRGGA